MFLTEIFQPPRQLKRRPCQQNDSLVTLGLIESSEEGRESPAVGVVCR